MLSAPFHVRSAAPEDIPVLLDLIRELAATEPSPVTATEADLLQHGFGEVPRFHTLLGQVDGQMVAFAMYVFTFSAYRGAPVLFLEDLYVRPQHRGRGFGRTLMRALAKEAVDRGCARFAWEVIDGNRKAIGFYESLGAELRRERLMTWLQGEALRRLARGED
jgi:GNAT superfamily N-acetyltransferase